MTLLAPTPFMVALIQTASMLPMALLALPAGALADIFDRKRLILTTQILRIFFSATLGMLTIFGIVDPLILLLATFALGFASAIGAPAWQAIIPDVVPREDIPEAVTLGAASFNTARGVGPAIGGFIVAAVGSGFAFLINSASLVWTAIVLGSWKRTITKGTLPGERLIGAMRTGMRYVRNSPEVKNALIHSATFSIGTSAMWALLPILAKQQLGLSSIGYGMLLGFFGAGGLISALYLPKIRRAFMMKYLIYSGVFVSSIALFSLAYSGQVFLIAAIMFIGGAAYLALLSTLMASLQSVTPRWVLGRVMSLHALVVFGTQAVGSAFWGFVADVSSISTSLAGAGLLLVGSLLVTHRYEILTGEELDLTPFKEWTLSPLAKRPGYEEGPVLVSMEYRIDPKDAADFLQAMRPMKAIRRKYGAIRWNLFRDVSDPNHYRESFIVESWAEHYRQHERFTASDIKVLEKVNSFNLEATSRKVDHFIAESIPNVKVGE